ncbi:MAG TPA: NAD(P)H-hydrate dehydratase [Chthoniobacteraceae bacterium]|nr:NAD(P)H-hydrate dehydratase [Chthoniobacteraceae bacterium]
MNSSVAAVTPELLRGMPLPQPDAGGDKEERGRVLVIAGSPMTPGAALLAGTAALRAGAGKLRIATCRSIATQLGFAVPEAYVIGLPETAAGGIARAAAAELADNVARADAVLIGPGMLERDEVAALTRDILACSPQPAFLLDAEALVGMRDSPEAVRQRDRRVLVTPHAGEMASLLRMDREEVVANPLAAARKAAALLGAVVVLKGGCTSVVTPDGEAWTYNQGNVGLATSGSGDVLAGVAIGLLARGASPVEAALWSVYLHGEAGNQLAHQSGPLGFLARELLAEIPGLMSRVTPAA